jgi:high affinity Mn2+ porin
MTRSFFLAIALALAGGRTAHAQASPPSPHEDTAFDFMNVLADHGLHPLDDETWNLYGQFTSVNVFRLPWSAPYTNVNGSTFSFGTNYEHAFTDSFTLYGGVRLWHGGELYVAPEVIAEHALSNLHGLGGAIEIYELQKAGGVTPTLYRSRLYLRQIINFGGDDDVKQSQPLQLGSRDVKKHRLVITAGNFADLDIFDKNGVLDDSHRTLINMAFMTHASWDFAADARGYSVGAAAELYWDDWVVRAGRMAPPKDPNDLAIDLHIWRVYSDTVELEHDHTLFGQPGAIRLLGYHNHDFSGRFADAIDAFEANPLDNAGDCPAGGYNYNSGNFNAPDLCWVRKDNDKYGAGINLEQFVTKGIGVFGRAMYSDGQSEVDAFNSADRDLSFGAIGKGALWHRPFDVAGLGVGLSWISAIHARYLELGGIDGFIGDGTLGKPGAEGVFEAFYSYNVKKAVWLSADYQLIWNPGYNTDRSGPISIPGVRVHAEF